MTANLNTQKGSCFYDQPVAVASGFTCRFEFQISSLAGGGADGMTFIIQNAASGLGALGDDGSGMGYAQNPGTSIENALAVEIDTWNSGQGDPNDNHVSVHTGGTGVNLYSEDYSIGNRAAATDLSSGNVHTMVVHYEGGVIEVFVDDLVNPLVSAPWDFATGGTYLNGSTVGGLNLIGGDSAYVGFTGGTGGANEIHDVLSWSWQDASGPIGTNYCGPATLNSSAQSGIIAAVGSDSASSNNVQLTASQCAVNQTGMFIVSQNTGFIIPPGSVGILCVWHPIGRYKSSLGSTGAGGSMTYALDLTQTPTSTGLVAIQPGETWYFQAWFTDVGTNNFTDGIAITFQ